jgi:hypothetical protein
MPAALPWGVEKAHLWSSPAYPQKPGTAHTFPGGPELRNASGGKGHLPDNLMSTCGLRYSLTHPD